MKDLVIDAEAIARIRQDIKRGVLSIPNIPHQKVEKAKVLTMEEQIDQILEENKGLRQVANRLRAEQMCLLREWELKREVLVQGHVKELLDLSKILSSISERYAECEGELLENSRSIHVAYSNLIKKQTEALISSGLNILRPIHEAEDIEFNRQVMEILMQRMIL